MAVSSVGGGAPQQINQQPQFVKLDKIDFTDDAGKTHQTFDNVSATRVAETNTTRTGFGIDLDGDGKFTKGKDGYLAFDMDGDGKYTSMDVQKTQDYLKALSGVEDLNGDGKVSFQEKQDAYNYKQQFGSADLDQDGVLSGWEMSKLGGMVVKLGTDSDGNNTASIQSLPGFEADRMPPQPNIMNPSSMPPNPEFDAWRNQMWSQWSGVLGIDLTSYFNSGSGQNTGGQFSFPPITASMFGGGGGGMQFPQFNFSAFDPTAGQSFDANGFPSFFSTGLGFL